ncbi:MAG: hypothetical protein IJX02_03805 [Clostridia bacterium]|nr:hypothetical protein [Clostridia bacterium]
MDENRVISNMLRHSELSSFYVKEKELLNGNQKEMSIYLFFEYVVADAIEEAITKDNIRFLKSIFNDMEVLLEGDSVNYSEVILNTIFENFTKEVIEDKLLDYFGKATRKLYEIYKRN